MPAVYDDLRNTVRAVLASEGQHHVLHPIALVREACFRHFRPAKSAVAQNSKTATEWRSRAVFLAMAVRQMRLVLTDYTGSGQMICLTDFPARGGEAVHSFQSMDHLLHLLATREPVAAKAFELRCFGGLTEWETAFILGVSTANVKREIESARVWFKEQVNSSPAGTRAMRVRT